MVDYPLNLALQGKTKVTNVRSNEPKNEPKTSLRN